MSIAVSSDSAPEADTRCSVPGEDAPPHLAPFVEAVLRIGFDVTESGCWEYRGARNAKGYGVVSVHKRGQRKAHRVMYEWMHGPFPEDRPLARHRCDNPSCINPSHIVPGTHEENMADMVERGRSVRSHTHCAANHEYTTDNTRWRSRGSRWLRECRECMRARNRAYYARKKGKA